MSEREKRIIEGYEEHTCLRVGRTELILAEKEGVEMPYLVCNCNWDNPLGVDMFSEAIISDSYVEVMRKFVDRADKLLAEIEQEREESGLPLQVLTKQDCVENGLKENCEGKVVVIDAKYITPEYRCAEHQLFFCESGNGCDPEALGTSLYGKTLFSGEGGRWRRHQVAGVIDPAHLPDWAKQKLAEREAKVEKPSIHEQLSAGKQKVASTETPPRQHKKDETVL